MKKPNEKLFQYEIVKKIGQGAFGQVLLGTKNNLSYAIKKISKKQIIKVNKLHEPFIEKQILYKLKQETKQYPYFVKIYETESDDDNIYLILEYCAGGTLEQYIMNQQYEHNTMKKIAARILLILQKLHSYKIVHRDIKPSNILFTQEGYVKLSDFGTAYAPDQFFSKQIAQQIRGIKQICQRKDSIDEDQKIQQKEKIKQNALKKQKPKCQQKVQQKQEKGISDEQNNGQEIKPKEKDIGQEKKQQKKKVNEQDAKQINQQNNKQNSSAQKVNNIQEKNEETNQTIKQESKSQNLKQQQKSQIMTKDGQKIQHVKIDEILKSQEKIRQNSQTTDTFYSIERRSTFVGTACYMAPQLLQNDLCGKEADLWAFGCILYEMIFKKSPFFDINEGMVWKKITNNEIKIQLSPDTKLKDQYINMIDLIKKLLIKDINKRLGFGQNGYDQIKNHPYFHGIQWQSQSKKSISEIAMKIETAKEQIVCNIVIMIEKPKQKVVFSGVVGKKAFFGNFKQRMLILYSTPKLVYYCTESGQKKGQFALLKNTPLTVEGKIFTISNQKKTYYFKTKTSVQWVQMIKNTIVNAYY